MSTKKDVTGISLFDGLPEFAKKAAIRKICNSLAKQNVKSIVISFNAEKANAGDLDGAFITQGYTKDVLSDIDQIFAHNTELQEQIKELSKRNKYLETVREQFNELRGNLKTA